MALLFIKTDLKICILCLLIQLKSGSADKETYKRLPSALAVVGRPFEYFIPGLDKSPEQYEVVRSGKSFLPKWLSYYEHQNLLLGVPSWHDKGSVDLEVKSQLGVTKAVFSLSVHDLHNVSETATLNVTGFSIPSFKEPHCPQGLPVAAATIIFDLHMGKLSGGARMGLMKRISSFVQTDTKYLHMSAGKGHNTAFGFKDVMMITAGPGNVADAKEPGTVVSWQIGCGTEAIGMVVGSLLKSSSERGAFHHALEAPVSAWHITTGQYPKVHHNRERRQVSRLSPTGVPTKKPPRKGNVTPTRRLIYATPTPTRSPVPAPSTIATRISVSLSSYTLASTVANTPPEIRQPIRQLKLYQGQGIRYLIPYNTFYDKEDSYTHNLRLDLRITSDTESKANSWILLNSVKQEIYGLPVDSTTIGLHKFQLVATDTGGLMANDTFKVHVMEDTTRYNHEFTILFDYTSALFMSNVEGKVSLMEKIASYYDVDISNVRVAYVSYVPGVSFNYHFDFVPYEVCNYPLLRKLIDGFWIKTEVNPDFAKALSPEFEVISVSYRGIGPCAVISNDPPELNNHIDRLNVFRGQGIRYPIPNDTFYDKEDMLTSNLVLDMRTINNEALLSTSWILLNSSQQEIYGLPFDIKRVGLHQFVVVGMDSGGKKAYDAFEVQVLEDTIRYNHEFAIMLSYDNATFMNNVGVRVLLLDKIAIYYGVNLTNVRVVSYVPGVVFTFRFDFVPHEICNHPFLLNLIDGFVTNHGHLNPDFVNALLPEFNVTSGRVAGSGPCATFFGKTFEPVGDQRGGRWWTYAIIPAIVLAIVLLLIGSCVLFLMACHRKQKMSAAEKKTFIQKRKPIVLQEEYEVKEQLQRQLLVLPNEKPPMYPRSPVPGGVRTEEERSVAYKAPSFASSRTPAGARDENVDGFGTGGSGAGFGIGMRDGTKRSSYNSYRYSSSSSTASAGGTRKAAYSGYKLPPAYVPP